MSSSNPCSCLRNEVLFAVLGRADYSQYSRAATSTLKAYSAMNVSQEGVIEPFALCLGAGRKYRRSNAMRSVFISLCAYLDRL